MKFFTHGKWILLGEHAVVRGKPALVFPLESRGLSLELKAEKATDALSVEANSPELQKAIYASLLAAEDFLQQRIKFHFSFFVESTIPLRAGLGSSAALSVSLSRLLQAKKMLTEEKLFPLALQMENVFHGTSSGLDVAVVLRNSPIRFVRGQTPIPLQLAWQPKLFLSDTGLRSSTSVCVEKVRKLARPDLDDKMAEAVALAEKALCHANGLADLQRSITLGEECFAEWDLIDEDTKAKIVALKKAGALAVKPTGSGAGGFLLSLWQENPPEALELIPSNGRA